jgi:hypothetical protein
MAAAAIGRWLRKLAFMRVWRFWGSFMLGRFERYEGLKITSEG